MSRAFRQPLLRSRRAVFLGLCLGGTLACSRGEPARSLSASPPEALQSAPQFASAPVLASAPPESVYDFARTAKRLFVGAGDIASCEEQGDEASARQLDRFVEVKPDTVVFTLGDNVYPVGAASEYAECYAPTWGRHKARTLPSIGNHDATTDRGRPYHDYFGARAGEWGKSRVVEKHGPWTLVTLNSNCDQVDCGPNGEQAKWLEGELAKAEGIGPERAARKACTAVLFHHPRFSSGPHGDEPELQDTWRLLAEAEVELVLAGHDHGYERFVPFTPQGVPATGAEGTVPIVAGTGGKHAYPFKEPRAGSVTRFTGLPGVLALDLADAGYRGRFVTADEQVRDAFEGVCR